jgi:hypothetical protein
MSADEWANPGAMKARAGRRGVAIATLIGIATSGCTTLHVETGSGPAGARVEEQRSDWLFAVAAERVEDVRDRCPHGVLRIVETTTAPDALVTAATLGLLWRRTIRYECRGARDT